VQTPILLARVVITFAFLIYASWSDYKTREVSNTVWMIFAPIGLTLTLIDIYMDDPSSILTFGICFALTAAISLALFYSGGFGGADSKALMCLALALPFYPSNTSFPLIGETSPISKTFFPLTIFTNGVLLSAASAILILLYNLSDHARNSKTLFEGESKKEPFWKKILVLLTGYKMPIAELKEKWHIYPLEDIKRDSEGHVTRKLILLPKDEGRNEVIERLENAASNGIIQQKVWATPGLPMLIFITVGFAFAFIFGDIVWTCIRLVLR
jgi:preflagellin peptidase FlaK